MRADLRSISAGTPKTDKGNPFFIISGNARYKLHDTFTETIPKLDINYITKTNIVIKVNLCIQILILRSEEELDIIY